MSGRGVVGSTVGCQSASTGSSPVVRSKFRYFVWLDGELIVDRDFPVTDPKYLRRILVDANKKYRGRAGRG